MESPRNRVPQPSTQYDQRNFFEHVSMRLYRLTFQSEMEVGGVGLAAEPTAAAFSFAEKNHQTFCGSMVMLDARTKGWVEAANLFETDLQARMICPDCKKGSLHAQNIVLPNGKICERRIFCDFCNAQSYVRVA